MEAHSNLAAGQERLIRSTGWRLAMAHAVLEEPTEFHNDDDSAQTGKHADRRRMTWTAASVSGYRNSESSLTIAHAIAPGSFRKRDQKRWRPRALGWKVK